MRKKVLLAFDDPGGGLAVISVIEELIKIKELELKIYSGRLSEKFLSGYTYEKIDSQIEEKAAEEILDEFKPDIIITATGGGNAEQHLRNLAFRRKTKSIVILDFWKDYGRRWLYADYELKNMTDKICVMDEETKSEMTEEGFPENKLIVTGHPYLDKIFKQKKVIPDSGQSSSEYRFKKILFLSQPLKIMGLENYNVHPLTVFMEALKRHAESENFRYTLIIKPHPSENELTEISEISEQFATEKIEINISEENDVIKLIKDADIVAGYNTIAMFEARALNKRTISLSIAKIRNSLSGAMNRAGIEISELNPDAIFNCLNKEIISEDTKGIFEGGIRNTTDLILKELNIN